MQSLNGVLLSKPAARLQAPNGNTAAQPATVIAGEVWWNSQTTRLLLGLAGNVWNPIVVSNGVAGGQTITGGLADEEDLHLRGTTTGLDSGSVFIDESDLLVDEINPNTSGIVLVGGVSLSVGTIDAPGAIHTNTLMQAEDGFQVIGGTFSTFLGDGEITRDSGSPTTFNIHNPTSTLTLQVEGNTVWHAGNDGAGSTLDSDLLDGQQGAFYQSATNLTSGSLPFARIQVSASSKLLGRGAGSGAGDMQEITLGTNLSMSGTTLNASGGGGGSAHVIEDNGTPLTARANLNFIGFTVADNSGNSSTDVTFPTTISVTSLTATSAINFSAATSFSLPTSGITGAGAASGLDADLLEGQHGSFYQSATNLTAGSLPFARVQVSAASKLLGRGAGSGAGDMQEITLGTNLSMSGTTINAAGGSGHTIQDEGTPLTARTALNFIGAYVSVADNSGNNSTDVTITGLKKYTHTQSSNSASWSVAHNLGTNDFTLTIYDNSSPLNVVDPDSITITDTNNIVLTFAVAFQGKAVLVG